METHSNVLLHVGEQEEFVREAVTAADIGTSVESVETVSAAITLLETEPVTGIVLEAERADEPALDLLDSAATEGPHVPGLVLTSDRSLGAEMIEAGASDVFVRGGSPAEVTVLGQRLTNIISQWESLSEYAAALSDTALLLDDEGRIVTATLGSQQVFADDTAEQIVGKQLSALVSEEDTERTRRLFGEFVTEADTRERIGVSFELADGTNVPGEILLTRLSTPSGGSFVVATIRDTLRQARGETTPLVDLLLNTLDDVFYLLDADGNLVRWNESLSEVTGYEDDEIAELGPVGLFAEEDRERIAETITEVVETGSGSVEAEMLTKDGERVPFEYTGVALTDATGTTRGIVGIGRNVAEQRQRERDLQQYETIIEVLADPVYAVDSEGRYTYVNDAFVEHTGYSRAELLGSHVSKVLPDEEIQRGREVIRELLTAEEGQSRTWEMTRVTADGEQIETENHTALLPPGEDGQYRGSVGVIRDISERKERERKLRREHDRLRSVFDAAPYPFVHVGYEEEEPIVLNVNDNFEAVFGYGEELLGETLDSHIVPESEFAEVDEFNERMRAEEAISAEVTRETEDGSEREFLFRSATLSRADGTVEALCAYVDITERKEREEELRLKTRAIDEAPIGITIHDASTPEGPITYVNDGFETVTGYGPDAIEGSRLSVLAGAETDEADVSELSAAFAERRPTSLAMLLYDDDGQPFWGRISVAPVSDEEGTTTHFVGFLQDVTTIKEHEQEVARRLEEFGELLAEDLRVPVQQAQSEIDAAANGESTAELSAASRSLERVDDLIDDLVTVHTRTVTSREISDSLSTLSAGTTTGEDP